MSDWGFNRLNPVSHLIPKQKWKQKNEIELIPLININLASTVYKALSFTDQHK